VMFVQLLLTERSSLKMFPVPPAEPEPPATAAKNWLALDGFGTKSVTPQLGSPFVPESRVQFTPSSSERYTPPLMTIPVTDVKSVGERKRVCPHLSVVGPFRRMRKPLKMPDGCRMSGGSITCHDAPSSLDLYMPTAGPPCPAPPTPPNVEL